MLRLVTGISIRIFVGIGVIVSGGAQTANFVPEFEKVSIKTLPTPGKSIGTVTGRAFDTRVLSDIDKNAFSENGPRRARPGPPLSP
jgi:hypothetical protein